MKKKVLGDSLFQHCYFITGKEQSVVIITPEHLPADKELNVSVSPQQIFFMADYEAFACVPYFDEDVYHRLIKNNQVGIIAFSEGQNEPLPTEITHVARVEIEGVNA